MTRLGERETDTRRPPDGGSLSPSAGQRLPRCVYCGALIRPTARVCRGHSDLPALDPTYPKEVRP